MKKQMRGALIMIVCIATNAMWAEAVGEKKKEAIWDYVPPAWKAPADKKFSASLEFGTQQHDGTTSYEGASGALALKYEPGIYELTQTVNFDYLSCEDAVSQNQLKSYTGADWYFGCRFWGFLLNDYERNPPQHVDLKERTGVGIKYDLLRNAFWKLNVGVAPLYREQRSTEGKERGDEVLSARLLFRVNSDSTTYSFVGFYMPALSDGNYEWSVDTALTFNLTKAIALKVGWLYNFNSDPLDAGVSKWDRECYTHIQYEF